MIKITWETIQMNWPHMQVKLLPLLKFLREHEIEIIFSSPSGLALADELEYKKHNEPLINSPDILNEYLNYKCVNKIFYAGYATNLCVLDQVTGMKSMNKLGYKVILIEDCSLPVPSYSPTGPESIEFIKKELGGTVTINEFKNIVIMRNIIKSF